MTLFFQLALRCLQNYYNSLLPWHPYNPVVCCLNLKRSKVEECLKLKLPKLDEDDFKLNLLFTYGSKLGLSNSQNSFPHPILKPSAVPAHVTHTRIRSIHNIVLP